MYGKKTILFVDEIHRFNKGQQDYLLPFVEDGTLILIGATTENPYFEVNGALISRSRVFELKSLEKEDIKTLLKRAVYDTERGMGSYDADITEEALEFLADISGGDARSALNAVELGILTTERGADGKIHITLDVAQECIQKRAVRYDKSGDNHYDTISAFIKSLRGSDPDAAVYYLAKMLYAGEDIKFIARRLMISASEDVGNADPNALNVAVSASLAVERIGMPEAQIILAQAATYIAGAPKSNASYNAIFAAMDSVKTQKTTVPVHLQDAHYKGAAKLGHGIGYKYAHDYPEHYVKQQYLPDEIQDATFYSPTENGYEKQIKDRLERLRNRD
jgi:putative ATPase